MDTNRNWLWNLPSRPESGRFAGVSETGAPYNKLL